MRALGHGKAGAEWLSQAGHAELSRSVAAHPVMALEEPGADEWVLHAPLEERIVCYADKRATQRVVSLEQRFERWRRRHPEHLEQLDRVFAQARRLEAVVCEAASIRPEAVERLRWVEQARDRALANGRLASTGNGETASATAAEPRARRAARA